MIDIDLTKQRTYKVNLRLQNTTSFVGTLKFRDIEVNKINWEQIIFTANESFHDKIRNDVNSTVTNPTGFTHIITRENFDSFGSIYCKLLLKDFFMESTDFLYS